MPSHNDIVLFYYQFSPYACRVTWYLALRGISYAQCLQPMFLPREDINALGVKYRRIPIMSIGRDIYCDTRLILLKLEEKYPSGALGASQPDQKAFEKLLESYNIDGGVFVRAAQAIPPETPLLKDPQFTKDREEYTGRSWSQETIKAIRPEALAHLRDAFAIFETTLLADGRQWVLNTNKPSLADIEAIWPFEWLIRLRRALPPTLFGKDKFPKVYAWIERFNEAIAEATSSSPQPTNLKGPEAVRLVTAAEAFEPLGEVDAIDPLGLKKGQVIESWPIDSGFTHHDRGRLLSLTSKEVVLATQSQFDSREIRVHHPRWNFRIRAVGGEEARL